jgi:predicted metal-dependent enzyme (double-stranded beta helix superfamily)
METDTGCRALIARLDRAVTADSVEGVTRAVKQALEELLGEGTLALPPALCQPRPETYARRLLHRDPGGRYTAIVMTWGPGQGTPVHDHGGLWCVEGVVDGLISVTRYDVEPQPGDRYRVAAGETVTAGLGEAGRLIPPTDHHVIANALSDRPSVTLHVYGGELDACHVFLPAADGLYDSCVKPLGFHD